MLIPVQPSTPCATPSTPCDQTSPDRPSDPGAGDVVDRLAWLAARAEVAVGRWQTACERVAERLAPGSALEVT